MKPEEQRIALAKWSGWTEIQPSNHYELVGRAELGAAFGKPIPDYLSDLNAVHELEKGLSGEQWLGYEGNLRKLALPEGREGGSMYERYIHATAVCRCEALLKTLGLWTS